MSATFKNAKKKISQTELRKFMQEHKKEKKEMKQIDSPLAKYNEQGQLTCILCKSIVRSEAVWTVHINAKQHRENVDLAKKLKERTNNFTTPLKRPLTPPMEIPEKKTKSILKNPLPNAANNKKPEETVTTNFSKLPDDFFDGKSKSSPEVKEQEHEMQIESICKENSDTLPEGFFDDPKLDAKARNQEYKDPIEEEWERFQKEIKSADSKSAAIIAEDQEEATTERQIDEIDEQLKKLSRVLDLEKKKVEIISNSNESKNNVEENSDDDEYVEVDEFLDWRSKRSFQ